MKDCKCGRIPPCYSGRVFNIYEETKRVKEEWDKTQELWGAVIDKMRAKLMEGGFFDDTYHKVYGVNEQLCDLGKTILTKNKDDMEEKKTKKMTKAEAFEYLKGKKVLCYSSKMEAIQVFVKSLGFHWSDYSEEPMLVSILFLGKDGRLTYSVSLKRFEEHEYEEISADDILSIEIVEEKQCSEEDALDLIITVGARLSEVLRRMEGHKHVIITENTVSLYNEGMRLFHSDPVLDYDR